MGQGIENFLQNYHFWFLALARIRRTNVSYICIIQLYYTTVLIHNYPAILPILTLTVRHKACPYSRNAFVYKKVPDTFFPIFRKTALILRHSMFKIASRRLKGLGKAGKYAIIRRDLPPCFRSGPVASLRISRGLKKE